MSELTDQQGADAPEQGNAEPGGQTTGMEHRNPDPDCPLCGVWGIPWDPNDPSTHGKQHIHAEALWREWDPTKKVRDWRERVAAEAAKLGIDVTAKQVQEHFGKHGIEQPMLSGRLQNEELIARVLDMPARSRAIIEGVYRQRVLLQRQIREIYYLNSLSYESARKLTKVELNGLAQEHMLYRYLPSTEDTKLRGARELKHFARSSLWMLGRAAVPYIQHSYELTITPPFVNRAREVAKLTLIHDIRANDVAVRLAEGLRTQQEADDALATASGHIKAEFRADNWWGPGPQMLTMGFFDRRRQENVKIQPDGFASIAIHPLEGDLPATQLPFFYEFDHGTKDTVDVARQLIAYHVLGHSRAATQRFPDLDAPGYSPPLVMVFSERKRVELVARRMRELWLEEYGGEEPGCQIMLVSEADWREDPLTPAVGINAWDERSQPVPFLDWLIGASRPLFEHAAISPNQILTLDPTQAQPKTEGAKTPEGLAKARAARQEKLAEQRAAREAAADDQAQEAGEGQADAPAPTPEPAPEAADLGEATVPPASDLGDGGAGASLDAMLGAEDEPAGTASPEPAVGDASLDALRAELAQARRRVAELEAALEAAASAAEAASPAPAPQPAVSADETAEDADPEEFALDPFAAEAPSEADPATEDEDDGDSQAEGTEENPAESSAGKLPGFPDDAAAEGDEGAQETSAQDGGPERGFEGGLPGFDEAERARDEQEAAPPAPAPQPAAPGPYLIGGGADIDAFPDLESDSAPQMPSMEAPHPPAPAPEPQPAPEPAPIPQPMPEPPAPAPEPPAPVASAPEPSPEIASAPPTPPPAIPEPAQVSQPEWEPAPTPQADPAPADDPLSPGPPADGPEIPTSEEEPVLPWHQPAPQPDPALQPAPAPVPDPTPEPQPGPAPEPQPTPEPAPIPQPAPEPPAPAPQPPAAPQPAAPPAPEPQPPAVSQPPAPASPQDPQQGSVVEDRLSQQAAARRRRHRKG